MTRPGLKAFGLPQILVFLVFAASRGLAVPIQAQSPGNINDLERALLTLEDLPPGWISSFPGEQGAYTTTRCGQDLTAIYPTIARQFKRSDLGPVLLHEIVVTSASAGLLAMSAARQRLAECPAWITSQVGRPTMRWSATEIPFPQITDETLAIRSVAPMLLVGQATGDQVTMRTGDVFNQIGYASIGTHDPEELGRYARLAAEKLTASMATP